MLQLLKSNPYLYVYVLGMWQCRVTDPPAEIETWDTSLDGVEVQLLELDTDAVGEGECRVICPLPQVISLMRAKSLSEIRQ